MCNLVFRKHRPIMYFAHPINTYNTPLETRLLAKIAEKFSDWEILNPNTKEHDDGFTHYMKEYGNPMLYFTIELLPKCGGVTGLPFRDRCWPAGVFKEMTEIFVHSYPMFRISPRGEIRRMSMSPQKCLTIEQTLSRILLPDRSTRSYD